MGKVILTLRKSYGRKELVSLKCKDERRAKEIADKRSNCIYFKFYNDGQSVPKPIKKQAMDNSIYAKIQRGEITMENIEQMLR